MIGRLFRHITGEEKFMPINSELMHRRIKALQAKVDQSAWLMRTTRCSRCS